MINKPTVLQRQRAWEKFCAEEAALLLNKGADYTAGQKEVDAYANFRIIADLLKDAPITSYTVAMIYFLKHVLSIITFAITGKQESGESLAGRFHDIRNYGFILNELMNDHVEYFEGELPVFGGTIPRCELGSYEVRRDPEDWETIWPVPEKVEEEFPYQLNIDSTHYWDGTNWCPVSELGKEVDNQTDQPTPQPGELESLVDYLDHAKHMEFQR